MFKDIEKMEIRLDCGDRIEVVPGKFEVCVKCRGRGMIVDPAVDGHGITPEDFDEDPDFKEGYLSGRYDIQCPSCEGRRVVLIGDEDRMSGEQLALYNEHVSLEVDRIAEMKHERMMGY